MIETILFWWVMIRVIFVTILLFVPDRILDKLHSKSSGKYTRFGFGIDIIFLSLIIFNMEWISLDV